MKWLIEYTFFSEPKQIVKHDEQGAIEMAQAMQSLVEYKHVELWRMERIEIASL